MKAIVLRQLGEASNLRIEEVPDPKAGPGEVLVRVRAAALNHRDVWIRKGMYAGIKLPIILGSDGTGNVESVGEGVDSRLVGQSVCEILEVGVSSYCDRPGTTHAAPCRRPPPRGRAAPGHRWSGCHGFGVVADERNGGGRIAF